MTGSKRDVSSSTGEMRSFDKEVPILTSLRERHGTCHRGSSSRKTMKYSVFSSAGKSLTIRVFKIMAQCNAEACRGLQNAMMPLSEIRPLRLIRIALLRMSLMGWVRKRCGSRVIAERTPLRGFLRFRNKSLGGLCEATFALHSDELLPKVAVLKQQYRWKAFHAKANGKISSVVDIHFCHDCPAAKSDGKFHEDHQLHFGEAAPRFTEMNQHNTTLNRFIKGPCVQLPDLYIFTIRFHILWLPTQHEH